LLCRPVKPAVLVQPGCRVAPRPIVGLGGVEAQAIEQVGQPYPLERSAKRLDGISLADLVGIRRPKFIEPSGDRAPFRGRRGIRIDGVRKRGLGRNLRGRKGVTRQ